MIGRSQIGKAARKPISCIGCGSRLTDINRSADPRLCLNCWIVNLAEIESEDREEDALSEIDRLKRFLA